jgi:hypothetical protein
VNWIRTAFVSDELAINKFLLLAILTAEAIALFVIRLPGALQFDNFAFFDTGANLTAQYLISHGYRPTLDFAYHYGLLPLLFGRIWFRLFGLNPIACVGAMPLIDILIVWGFVRFAANLKLTLPGILIILLTAPLTIPSSFLNLTHGIEPIFLIHALAEQGGGNRRRALALATVAIFVKPSMAYTLGLILLGFMVIDCVRDRVQPLHAFVTETWPAIVVGIAIFAVLAVTFGLAPVLRSVFPRQGLAMYRAQGFGFFNAAGRLFRSPPSAPWSYYAANIAGPWILYTLVLVLAAIAAVSKLSRAACDVGLVDGARESILTCTILHLSFVFLFFGNEFSWIYYFYIPVLGLATAARLSGRWRVLVACLAFAVPLVKVDKRIIERFATAAQEPGDNIAVLPDEPGFTYQLWFTTSPSPATAGLWATSGERDEWIKVLGMIQGHRASLLEYYGCADLLFPEFRPPVTLFLVPGSVTPDVLARKLSQLRSSSIIVMPRWHRALLDEIPEIDALVRHDYNPSFQGVSFIVYEKR